MALSQSMLIVSEDSGSVRICAELLKGVLGTNVSLSIEANFENDSGINHIIHADNA